MLEGRLSNALISFRFQAVDPPPHPGRGVPLVLKLLHRFRLTACKSHSIGSSVYHSRLGTPHQKYTWSSCFAAILCRWTYVFPQL